MLSHRPTPALGLALLWIALSAGCATYDTSYPRSESSVFEGYASTHLGRFFDEPHRADPTHSGVSYIRYGRYALEMRIAFADMAERSLDMQYYIWDADVSGRLLGERLVRAADRGVRVRVLLDDISIVGRDSQLAGLSSHPNIEIRAFNPFRHRNRWGDVFGDLSRINRRSHNKLMVIDNAVAIVGGRNIADHYFGVHGESNYRDLDVVAVGPVVRETSWVFDDFWSSKFAVPYAAFVEAPPTREELDEAVAGIRAGIASEPPPYPIEEDVAKFTENLHRFRDLLVWAPARVLYDDPSKAEDKNVRGIAGELAVLTDRAEHEVLIENAYFVPREPMVDLLGAAVDRGASVRVLTNSLASNDVVAVHSGYKKYRDDLLERGVEIYELRPDSSMSQRWSFLSAESQSGLHTKAMVVDRQHVVIGSFNLDPRSVEINSELVMLVDSQEFGETVAEFLDTGAAPENSYHVRLDGRKLEWTASGDDGDEVIYRKEPETSWWKRFSVGLIGILPIQSQL